jgi:hypothetical protein
MEGATMKKKRMPIKPPDPRTDRAQLVRVSRHDLQDLMEEPTHLGNLAELAKALEKVKEKKR